VLRFSFSRRSTDADADGAVSALVDAAREIAKAPLVSGAPRG